MPNREILNDAVRKLVNERVKAIESFIAVYLAEHPDLSMDDIELVERTWYIDDKKVETTWRIRKKRK